MPNEERPTPTPIRKNLFDYLSHLDEDKDFPAIKKYLQSPFFVVGGREKVIELFELLKSHYPDYEGKPELSISSLNKKMGITFAQNLKSTLIRCIEDYLKITRFRENKHWSVLLLTESLEKMGIHKLYKKIAKKEIEEIETKKVLTSDDYYLKYKLGLGKFRSSVHKEKSYSLEKAINNLSYFYLHTNLINLIAHETYSKYLVREIDLRLTYELINSVGTHDKISDLKIRISYLIFKSLKLENVEDKIIAYYELNRHVRENWTKLTIFFRYEIYINIINIVNDIVCYNTKNFKEEIFALHQFWIKKEVHRTYNEIDINLFLEIVIASCNSTQIEWARTFIKENQDLLVHKEKEQTIELCNAYIYFKERRMKESIQVLNSLSKMSALFFLNIKNLELKCWYELKDRYQFRNSLKKLRLFIRRHKMLSVKLKDRYNTSYDWIEKIENARFLNCNKNKETIKTELSKIPWLMHRIWISDKIEELTL